MAYTKQTWADLPSKTTPINATRLGHIEQGIYDAAQTADTAASTAGTAAANVGIVSSRVETLTERVNGLDTAVSNKVDKVANKGLSTNDYTDADKAKVDALGTASTKNSTSVVTDSSDLVESGAVYDAIQAQEQLLDDTVGWTGKNLYNYSQLEDRANPTSGGITYSDNGNDTVSITAGTTTGTFYTPNHSYLEAGINIPFKPSTGYIFSVTEVVENLKLEIYYKPTSNSGFTLLKSETGVKELKFTTPATFYDILMRIGADSGKSLPSVTLGLMVRKADIIDSTFEPYHASVEETIPQVISDAVGWDVGNLLVYPYKDTTKTTNGITFTVNDDNSITVNGTATADAYFFLVDSTVRDTVPRNVNLTLKGGNTQVKVRYYIISFGDEAGNEVDFNIPSNAAGYNLTLKVSSGVTVNNMVIYPKLYHFDVDKQKTDNSVIAPTENGSTASQAYAVGEHFIKDGQFKEVTQAISSGGAINDSNTTDKPIADCLYIHKKYVDSDITIPANNMRIFDFPAIAGYTPIVCTTGMSTGEYVLIPNIRYDTNAGTLTGMRVTNISDSAVTTTLSYNVLYEKI